MNTPVKRIGEIVLRTSNVDALKAFYSEVIGFDVYASFGNNYFLKVADDFDGHPQMLAIFDKAKAFSGPKNIQPAVAVAGAGTLHHFAFAMEREDFDLEVSRLQQLNLEFKFEQYEQFGWRSIHFHDPDGNSVEFVCYDSSLLDMAANARVRNTDSNAR